MSTYIDAVVHSSVEIIRKKHIFDLLCFFLCEASDESGAVQYEFDISLNKQGKWNRTFSKYGDWGINSERET